MHYHWGLGVGHIHAHQSASTSGCDSNLAEDAQDIDISRSYQRFETLLRKPMTEVVTWVMSQTTQSCV